MIPSLAPIGRAREPWFSKIADQFNMLIKGYLTGADGDSGVLQMVSLSAMNYVNLWDTTNGSASFGALVSAPDGSAGTAQKLVESAANRQHFVTAIFYDGNCQGNYRLRIAVYAKAAERTRIKLSLETMNSLGTFHGCAAIYDLAGAAVGVPAATFGPDGTCPPWTNLSATAALRTDGWVRCELEAKVPFQDFFTIFGVIAKVTLDAGAGNAAENTSYAGDGASGVDVWRSTMLPPGAFQSSSVVLFDDFNDPTMANIDVNDTRNPGYTWYVRNAWPHFPGIASTPAGNITQSGSVLTIAPSAAPLNLSTAAWTGTWDGVNPPVGSGYVGQLWALPQFITTKFSFDADVLADASPATYWTLNLDGLLAPWPGPASPLNQEFDYMESFRGPGSNGITDIATVLRGTSISGYVTWYPAREYSAGWTAVFNNILYRASIITTGDQPDISPGAWAVFDPLGVRPDYPSPPYPEIDFTAEHTYSALWLPQSANDVGRVLIFLDGRYAFGMPSSGLPPNNGMGHFIYGPTVLDSGGFQASNTFGAGDASLYPLFFGAGNLMAINIDWVRIETIAPY